MTRNVQNDPSVAIAHHFRSLAAANTDRARERTIAPPGVALAQRAFSEHRDEHARIGDLHQLIHIAGGLDAAARIAAPCSFAAARRASTIIERSDRRRQRSKQATQSRRGIQ